MIAVPIVGQVPDLPWAGHARYTWNFTQRFGVRSEKGILNLMAPIPLRIDSVVKRFGELTAVAGISLDVQDRMCLGLLGPNGAGKSTLIRSIAGRIRLDSGSIQVFGQPANSAAARAELGWAPQELALYPLLTGRENLEAFGQYQGLRGKALRGAIQWCLEWAALTDRADTTVKSLSGGMRRRLNMAAGLIHRPRLVLLDEPTVGVDPQSRNAIFENLEIFKKRGKTLIYTTHYMEEAERVCDRLIIIDHGKVVADDTLRGLYRLVPATNLLNVELDRDIDGAALEDLRHLPEVKSAKMGGGVLKVGVPDLSAGAPRILAWLAEGGHSFHHISSERADLETVFLTLTGRKLRD